ncbi:MAG: serine hydrolase [Candidatus Aminicenantes bacterium]|nr:MAG: serine hydrolase [Candidatus Aminicenantes bacterium]
MKRSRLLSFLLLGIVTSVALAGCGKADDSARIARVENGLQTAVVIKGDPAGNILDRMKHYGIPGVSVAVFDKDRIVWAKGYGVMDVGTKEPVTDKTLFVAGSISKPVAAMGALKLVEEGKIRLDDNINAVLTTWKLPENELTAKHPVTLRQLLSHSGGTTVHGFRGYAEGEAVPSITDILDGKGNSPAVRVDLEPGKQMRYSGGGVTVMQLALSDVEKAPFPEILRAKVLEPIGMTSSSYEQTFTPERLKLAASGHNAQGRVIPGKRHTYPEMAAAGLWTTPTDLAKFAIEVGLAARGRSNKVLSKETAGLMVKPQITIGGDQEMALGLFLQKYDGEVYYGHGGQDEGFIAQLVASRDGGYGAAVMTNSDGRSGPLIGEILRAIAAEYGWKGYLSAPLTPVALDRSALEGYVGRYRVGPDEVLTVAMKDGGLVARPTGEDGIEIVPVGAGEFVNRVSPGRLVFSRGASGPASEVSLVSPRGKRTAARMGEDARVPLELLREGRLEEAVAAYRDLWKKDPKDQAVAEGRINELGYGFLAEKKPDAAVALFEFNVERFPDSWNAHDSLGEGLAALGKTGLAIKSYERSLELNPGSANGRAMLEKLKKK